MEGREGVKWELGFTFFRGWEMGFCALGLWFMKKKTIEKWEWDFNLSNTGWDCEIWAGIWKKQFPGKWDWDPPFTPLIAVWTDEDFIWRDDDFFQLVNLSHSNGWRYFRTNNLSSSNRWPKLFERMKIVFKWIAPAIRMTRNVSEWMIQSIRMASHQSRTDEKWMANSKRTVFKHSKR